MMGLMATVTTSHMIPAVIERLPYLTRDFPGVGGVIKQRAEDFFVQEIPLYEPSGEGEHVYCEIQKINLTTFDAVQQIARALNVPTREIGYAGMKDARAISRQVLSIWGTTPEAVMALRLPNLSVLWAARHGNKLRLGHLAGNRFAIKIRDVDPMKVTTLRPVVDVIERRGMPNYFGEQRFGRRGDNDKLGAALIRDDNEALLKLLLGTPNGEVDDQFSFAARRAFDARDNAASMKAWPRRAGMERRILARLMKTHRPSAAVRAVDEKIRRLWVSALQSRVFNDVVARRIDDVDKLFDGDLAYKHENGACFTVESAAAEQPRADAWEISPTGPLVGYRMTLPHGRELEIEQAALAAVDLKPDDFRKAGKHKVKGARRALRVRPAEVRLEGGVDDHGGHITVAFNLPSGSYATVLLRELMKAELAEPENENSGSAEPSPEVELGDDPSAEQNRQVEALDLDDQ
ncbi:MAG: tRNA pseudouridine13 synthase [Phycisphaerales bacterium]|nr:tRNA pseudouridine13 synthase [Phycisphaerales bacterium]